MTKKEALNSLILYPVSDNLLEKILIDNGLISSDTYTMTDKSDIELCMAFLYKNLVTAPNFSQGSLSFSNIDINAMIEIANGIFKKNGLTDEIFGINKINLNYL